jgi:hypothetical protein
MRLTQALAVRNLIAKLHPPLSQTPRESQQLLSVLQNSFNRRLDDIHPSPQIPLSLRNHGVSGPLPDIGNLSANATNAHLQSILSHPSLEQGGTSSATSPVKIAELFDAALLQSSVNFSLIRSCVLMARTGLALPDKSEAALQLGSRIAAWFTASDAKTKRAFLIDTDLMSSVLPMMYLGDLEGTVWDWLRTLYEGSAQQQQVSDLQIEDRFIALMTRENIKRRDLSAAAVEYCEASDYRSSRVLPEVAPDKQTRHPLLVTGNLISAAVLLQRHRHNIPAPMYDRLLSHTHPEPTHSRTVFWPFLPLYHPVAAQSQPLYQALQDERYSAALLQRVGDMSDDRASKILISLLDGADLMLTQGPILKAQFMLDFAQQHFPSMLPERKSTNTGELIQQARKYVSVQKYNHSRLAVA